MSRPLRALLVAGMVGVGLVAVSGQQAVARESYVSIDRTTWAFIDSRAPDRAFVDPEGDVPVGAWRDSGGKPHVSKAYFTFDVSALRGARVLQASAFAAETAANDCDRPRATELWVTDTATRPTWARQPTERSKLAGPGALPGCLWSHVEWDAAPAIQRALAAGSTRLTLAMRMSEPAQDNVKYGRRYANNLWLSVRYNRAPDTPTDLSVANVPCAGEPPYVAAGGPVLRALLTDPDDGLLIGRFAVWPAERPDARSEFTTVHQSSGTVHQLRLPEDLLADGREYAWAVQADDENDVSAWSAPCHFMTDHSPPDAEPGVSSEVYREDESGGGPGVPGEITFSANGVSDVAGYHYGEFEPSTFVAADALGGTATITFTPDRSGPVSLAVHSVDRAGNASPTRHYRFWVRNPAPMVSCGPEHAELGVPRECTFTPGMDDVVSYTYTYDGGPETTVPAGDDGAARVTVVPPSGLSTLAVFSTTSQGERSPTSHHPIYLYTEPEIGCLGNINFGEPLECTFRPTNMSGVLEYTYRLNDGPETTVPADPDGAGRATFTVFRPGWNELTVVAATGQGLRSSPGRYGVYLFTSPVVSSDAYPRHQGGGGPGIPGDFVFAPGAMPGVVEYVYRFNGEPEVVVRAGPDGRATVTFTPDRSGWMDLTVHSRTADGVDSDSQYYPFLVNP